jgi:aminopeptidase N
MVFYNYHSFTNPNHSMKNKLFIISLFIHSLSFSQTKTYNPERTHKHDLLHTRLDIKPDWSKQYLYGTATLKLKPYFYPQNTLELDAKGFDIQQVMMNNQVLKYNYDNRKLTINLGNSFSRKDTFTIQIKYVAKPNELESKGSLAITSDKGLYFVNADGSKADVPRQIWTQGETEANSCWFPTIDSPNEKMTQEIFLTVDNQYITLSNGKLIESKNNNDGTRTDYWKQDKPHAVYLTMIAAGDFKKVIDPNYKDFEVSYYVEPNQAQNALAVFGRTPDMIRYFENLLGVKYQWDKYAQIAVREYVSGAMENTTATVHGDGIQKDKSQLVDDNDDGVIAHELFHHWFGDLVTAESWANLPLNESFADYSEYLWINHKYGQDEGDLVALNAMTAYLNEAEEKREPLIRFYHSDKEDMFDSHSYAKGGRILHLLRKQVGDEAFFESLKRYLQKNAYKNAEIHDLRMAFEEVTGEDLNWFFNQWFMQAGHPELTAVHQWKKGNLTLKLEQTQDTTAYPIYRLPLTVEVWANGIKNTHQIILEQTNQTFSFASATEPSMVLIDPESTLVGRIKHQKSEDELIYQYYHAERMTARLKALDLLTYVSEEDSTATDPLTNKTIRKLLLDATKDKFWRVRQFAVGRFYNYDGEDFLEVEKALQARVRSDDRSYVRADAILAMKNFLNSQNDMLFRQALNDSSATVQAAAIEAILASKPADAGELVLKYENSQNPTVFMAIANYYAEEADPNRYDWFEQNMRKMNGGELYQVLGIFGSYLVKSSPQIQKRSLGILGEIAKNHSEYFVRFNAVQTLVLLMDVPETKKLLKEIVKNEKDERLLKVYRQLQDL